MRCAPDRGTHLSSSKVRTHSHLLLVVLCAFGVVWCSLPSGEKHSSMAAAAPAIGDGTVTADVARRFELVGRAVAAALLGALARRHPRRREAALLAA